MHRSAKMDASERDPGKWRDSRVSPFDLSQTLPVGGGLLVPYSLSGSLVITWVSSDNSFLIVRQAQFWALEGVRLPATLTFQRQLYYFCVSSWSE